MAADRELGTFEKSIDYVRFRAVRNRPETAELLEMTAAMEIPGKSKKPKVSIVIPAYNRAWCLAETLDSVLHQSFSDFEVIVVDDGSTDATLAVLKQYPQVRSHRWEANQGVSAARNQGIRLARGELICFLDSDDRWLRHKLQTQVDWMREHPEAVACYTDEIWIRNGVRVNPRNKHRKYSGDIFRQCLPLCLISPSSIMMRASVLTEIGGFDTDLPACEDYDLWLRLTSRYPVQFLPESLIVKTGGHADQLSQKYRGMDRFRVYALEKILMQNHLRLEQRQAVFAMLAEKYGILGAGYRNRGKQEEAGIYEQAAERYRRTLETDEGQGTPSLPRLEKEVLLYALED